MSEFNLSYPIKDNKQESKVIKSGEISFIIGANGKGKSTLMHKFCVQNIGKARRITAHRQVWFKSNVLNLTPESRERHERDLLNINRNAESRCIDFYADQRTQINIFDLIDAENILSRKIAEEVRRENHEEARKLADKKSPLSMMNDILKIANLDVQISIDSGSKVLEAIRKVSHLSESSIIS